MHFLGLPEVSVREDDGRIYASFTHGMATMTLSARDLDQFRLAEILEDAASQIRALAEDILPQPIRP